MAPKKGCKNPNGGRKRTEIDWTKVANLLKCQCTTEGIAAIVGVEKTTLYRRCEEDNNISYTVFCQQNRMQGVESLRAKQYQVAMEGDKTMLIWLGKQLLGQKEKQDITTNDKDINTASRVVFDFTGEESDEVKESEVSDESEIEED